MSVTDVKIAFVVVDIGLLTGDVELELTRRVTVSLFNGRPVWLLVTVLLRAATPTSLIAETLLRENGLCLPDFPKIIVSPNNCIQPRYAQPTGVPSPGLQGLIQYCVVDQHQ